MRSAQGARDLGGAGGALVLKQYLPIGEGSHTGTADCQVGAGAGIWQDQRMAA